MQLIPSLTIWFKDIGFIKNDETTFTGGQLKGCLNFALPTISKFFVTYNSDYCMEDGVKTKGFWGGKFIEIKLDNQTMIHCNIYQKVGKDHYGNGKFQQDISGSCFTLL